MSEEQGHDRNEGLLTLPDQLHRAILDAVGYAVVAVDPEGRVLYWNDAAAHLCGVGAERTTGQSLASVLGRRNADVARAMMAAVRRGLPGTGEYVVVRRGGVASPVVVTGTPIFDECGRMMAMVGVARDGTERRAAHDAQARFDASFERSPLGVAVVDLRGRPMRVNAAACRMLGRSADELLAGNWSRFVHPDDAALAAAADTAVRSGCETWSGQLRALRPDGSTVWVQLDVTRVCGRRDEPQFLLSQLQDITERKTLEAELEHRGLHDDLTGLPNRALLTDRLGQALVAARRRRRQVGVVFLDVDGFKHVNDALGHAAGDALLVELAQRLLVAARPGDTVARFGGDEFVVVCQDVTADDMAALAAQLAAGMAAPWSVGGQDVGIHVSTGITISRQGSTGSRLLSEADAAMYRAKELGRGRVAVFDDSLRDRAVAMLDAEHSLRSGLGRDEVVPWYQPVVDIATGRVVGVEALARWERGGQIVAPSDFIGLAESTGLIVPLGERVLLDAATTVAGWNRARHPEGTDPIWVSVNLSARQLDHDGLVGAVRRVLNGSGLAPHLLHLEVTESVVMADFAESVVVLEQLKDLGVQLSIDDFGTGHSSLSRLKQLPVDVLKIDRSFVDGLGADPDDTAIVEAIIGMGRALGLRCLAEGVETPAQRGALVDLGCELGQGFLWSRPLSGTAAAAWLEQQRSAHPAG